MIGDEITEENILLFVDVDDVSLAQYTREKGQRHSVNLVLKSGHQNCLVFEEESLARGYLWNLRQARQSNSTNLLTLGQ